MISIVLPVKDGGDALNRCLLALREQEISEDVEVVVVDSGSTDGSKELAESFGARVYEIPPATFNHGETRNVGASLANGDILVFTVDDALPADHHWLARLVAPLREDNDLIGSYSRQVARPGAPPHQRYYVDFRFGPEPRDQRASSPDELTVQTTLFSNVASAIRAPLLDRYPFPDDIVIAEDLEWCSRVLLAGYGIRYVPESVVQHSHDYSLVALVKRYFDQGAAAKRSFMAPGQAAVVRGAGLSFVRDELGWMWSQGYRRHIPYALAHEFTRYLAFQLGLRHHLVPKALRARISRTSTHWDRLSRGGPQSG